MHSGTSFWGFSPVVSALSRQTTSFLRISFGVKKATPKNTRPIATAVTAMAVIGK